MGRPRASVRVVLELDGDAGRIAGTLDPGDGPAQPFDGWLELSALLERSRRPRPRAAQAGDAPAAASPTRL